MLFVTSVADVQSTNKCKKDVFLTLKFCKQKNPKCFWTTFYKTQPVIVHAELSFTPPVAYDEQNDANFEG